MSSLLHRRTISRAPYEPRLKPILIPVPLPCPPRGLAVLNSPLLNKGTAFTSEERKALRLTGLLPTEISTLATQVSRAYSQYNRLPDALSRSVYLTTLHDRNEVLFYRLFSEHLREMIPIVNDRTVGSVMEQYHHECRRPRGVYLSINHVDAIRETFANLDLGPNDVDLIVATDAGQILGNGDCGIGGMDVTIDKLAIYTAVGGVDPARVIPVMLDAGTNRQSLLSDPLYIGNRHARLGGERYQAFIDAYVNNVTSLFPNAPLEWEGFEPGNGRRILQKYRGHMCTFSADMQRTGAITLAAAISAVRICGIPFHNQRFVIFGAGSAGTGVAGQIRNAMVREGLSKEDASKRFWCVDRLGLLSAGMSDLRDYQEAYARPAAENTSGASLAGVVHRVKPTMLIGASSDSGAFTEEIVKEMAAHTERPIIFVLSGPAARAEAKPEGLIAWTDGRAPVATGSPSAPVTYGGVTYVVAHIDNAMRYLCLTIGTIVSRAGKISDGIFAAAASAVSSLISIRHPGASLLPQIGYLRSVSVTVAAAGVPHRGMLT